MADTLRHRPRPQSGELPAADAAHAAGARGVGVSRPACDRARPAAAELRASSMRARASSPRRWRKRGIGRGDTVSAVLANTPAMLECHYGVPMAGAVLNTINTRLDAAIIAFQLDHGEAKVLITDREFSKVVKEALALAKVKPLVDRLRRSGIFRRGRAARRDRIRGFHRGRRSGFRLDDAGRRMGRDRAQLHLGHHRRSQGRGLSPSRRLSARARQRAHRRDAPSIRSICGRCRCSTATAGAFPGRISVVAGTHVCLRAVRAKAMYDADRRRTR